MKKRLLAAHSFLRYLWTRGNEDHVLQIAGSLAFTTLLALAPVFAIAVALLSRAPFFEQILVQIKIFLLLNLVPEIAYRIITVYMEEFAANAVRLTTFGVAMLFMSALATMLTVDHSIHAIWRERRSRPAWISLVAYAALLLLGPMLIALSVSITTYLMSLSTEVDISQRAHSLLLQVVPSVVSALAFLMLYKLVPHRRVRWLHAGTGAVVASALFEGAKAGFAIYVANVPGYNALYGAFVAVPFFLLWIYLSWVIVLLGAEITAALGQWPEAQRQDGET